MSTSVHTDAAEHDEMPPLADSTEVAIDESDEFDADAESPTTELADSEPAVDLAQLLEEERLTHEGEKRLLELENEQLRATIDDLQADLAAHVKREQVLEAELVKLPGLHFFSVTQNRETYFVVAQDHVEAAEISRDAGLKPNRIAIIENEIIWPAYLSLRS